MVLIEKHVFLIYHILQNNIIFNEAVWLDMFVERFVQKQISQGIRFYAIQMCDGVYHGHTIVNQRCVTL